MTTEMGVTSIRSKANTFQGAIFGPYTPLQQLDMLADFGTKSYLVGSTNSLLLQQKDRYSDILINLDESTVSITSPSLKSALTLTAADRRWIDFLTQEINETWDEANPSRPKTMQYVGSEEFIRSQFEAYILGLISSVKFHNFLSAQADPNVTSFSTPAAEDDPAVDFGLEWIEAWKKTENYRMWDANTDANLFAVSEPKHPCAGGLTIEDVQRRISEQVKDLHLDERFAQGREILGRNFAAGREKASSMFNKLYSDMEYLRESQRRRAEEARGSQAGGPKSPSSDKPAPSPTYAVDLAKAQQTMQTVGTKAGAYMSSWASWAGEKRKNSNWGSGWRNSRSKESTASNNTSTPASPIDKDYQMVSHPGSSMHSTETGNGRPTTQASFSESILSGTSSSADRPETASTTADGDALGITAISSNESASESATAATKTKADAKNDNGFQTERLIASSPKKSMSENTSGQATPVVPPVDDEDASDDKNVKDTKTAAEDTEKEAKTAEEEPAVDEKAEEKDESATATPKVA